MWVAQPPHRLAALWTAAERLYLIEELPEAQDLLEWCAAGPFLTIHPGEILGHCSVHEFF